MQEELNGGLRIALAMQADIGEGPFWDQASRTLVFVDSTRGRIHRFDPTSGHVSSLEAGQQIGAAIPRRAGGFVASAQDGLLSVDAETGAVLVLVPVEQDLRLNRMNDAKCDSRGRLWSGTFSYRFERGAGTLYRIGTDLTLTAVAPHVSVSNGIAWSPDERLMYYVDTGARTVDVFDYDSLAGEASTRRPFIRIAREDGLPDGLTVDADGDIWLALYRGGAVRRYTPDGEWVGSVTLPVSRVTSCQFGGPDLRDLYITTAAHAIHDDGQPREPEAGMLFVCRPGVAGLPSRAFGG